MAALTWRDVAAPDFGTSLQGINQFSRLLDNAFQGASSAAGRFDSAQDEMANRAIMERSLAIRDPAAYEAALADGSLLGSDKSRASTATLAGLDNRVGTLTNQALGKVNLSSATRQNDQAIAMDAAGPDAVTYQRLMATDPKAAAAYRAEHAAVLDNPALGYRNLLGIEKGALDFETGGLANANTRQNMDLAMRREGRDATQFGWTAEDRALETQLEGIAGDMRAKGYEPGDFDAYAADHGITGRAYFKLSSMIGAGGVGGGGGSADISGLGGTSDNPWLTQVGGGTFPSSVKTVGDAINYGESVLIPQTRNSAKFGLQGTGKGTSAMGAYQITSGTLKEFGPKALGANWKNADFTDPNVQDRIAAKIFQESNGSAQALMNRWASLTPAQAKALVGKPWSQARGVIAAGETSASPRAMAVLGDGYRQGTLNRSMQTNGDSVATAIQGAMGDHETSSVDVANRLTKKFPNAGQNNIEGQLDLIMSYARTRGVTLTPAAAGAIYERSGSAASWAKQGIGLVTGQTYSMGGGRAVDSSKVAQMVDDIKTGKVARTAVANQAIARDTASIDAAVAKEQAALAELNRRTLAAQRNPRYDPALVVRARQNYEAARQASAQARAFENANNRAAAKAATGDPNTYSGGTPQAQGGFLDTVSDYWHRIAG